MIKVFISHPTPSKEEQNNFLTLIKNLLSQHGLDPVNLGVSNYDFRKPLKPIKELIDNCQGAIVVGLIRHHSYIGYDNEGSTSEKEVLHKYTTSPWLHIEGGMAYQSGIPLIILKDQKVYPEGILDPNNSDSYIFDFILDDNIERLSEDIIKIIESWIKQLKKN
ncbi:MULTISPECIES: hypothetical protein [unclassified Sphingobacterium]|uniref:hypothetical protein n=1 Tax=unclassified Sphingobacterium TaxID=2609468 RepID=UPI0025EDC769|nr:MULTISPECIES: hypothetical protein [unclassified Sphingobacterium]